MFTGIIEHSGTIEALALNDDGGRITIHAPSVAPSMAVSNSIAVNGCCLTIVDLHNGRISFEGISRSIASWHDNMAGVAVIPYTYQHTNVHDRRLGDAVNLGGDVLGKYVERYLQQRSSTALAESPITVAGLIEEGF